MIKVFRVASPYPNQLREEIEGKTALWLQKLPADAQVQTSTAAFTSAGTSREGKDEYHLIVTFTVTASSLEGL